MKKTKRKVRKQSGDRVSRLAGRLLRITADCPAGAYVTIETSGWNRYLTAVGPLRSLCASVLSQDETKGRR